MSMLVLQLYTLELIKYPYPGFYYTVSIETYLFIVARTLILCSLVKDRHFLVFMLVKKMINDLGGTTRI